MKKLLFIILVFFGILSCTPPAPKNIPLTFDTIREDTKIYASNDSTKPYLNLTMSFTYPVAYKNDTIIDKLQKDFVLAFLGEDYAGRSPKGAFDAYKKDFAEKSLELASAMSDDLSMFGECYEKIITEVADTAGSIITVKTERDSYMGGAHGSYNLRYNLIDKESGELLTEKDIFDNYSEGKVIPLILKVLSDKYGDSLNDVIFDKNDIHPNGNFFFDKDGLVYVYNEYEIAPYSTGTIVITIPYKDVNGLLSPLFRKK